MTTAITFPAKMTLVHARALLSIGKILYSLSSSSLNLKLSFVSFLVRKWLQDPSITYPLTLPYQTQWLDCDTGSGKVVLSIPAGFRNLYLFQARERKFVVQPVLNLDHISWWIWNYFVGMRSAVRTLSSSVFTVCKMLTFWLWNKVCLTVWNAHVPVRPNTKQVSTLFNQCKLYFEIQNSSPQFGFNYSEWRGYLGGFSVKRRKSVVCSISYIALSSILENMSPQLFKLFESWLFWDQ